MPRYVIDSNMFMFRPTSLPGGIPITRESIVFVLEDPLNRFELIPAVYDEVLKFFANEAAVHMTRDVILDALHTAQGNPNALWPVLFNTLYAGEQAEELALRALQNVDYVQDDPRTPPNATAITDNDFDMTDLRVCQYARDQTLPIMTCNAQMYRQIQNNPSRRALYGDLEFWVPGHGRIIHANGNVFTFG